MINVAVIGVGNMGKNHARVYYEIEDVKLVALSDVNKNVKRIAKKYRCKFYEDYVKMLESEDIDAVSIAVPTLQHYNVAKTCLEYGKHILIEKPITNSVKKAEELISKAKEENLTLMVGHIERFNPAINKLKEMIKSGKLGKIISISARRVGIFPPQIEDASVILDLGIHDIDIFNYLTEDKPIEVYGRAEKVLSNKEDHVLAIINYTKTSCIILCNWITPVKIRTLSITGSKGYAELDYISQELKFYKNVYEKSHEDFGEFVIKFSTPYVETINIKKEEPLKLELKHFLNCIEKNETPIASGEDALKALRIALSIIESYKKCKIVKV